MINKVPLRNIVNIGAPSNIVSIKLVRKLNLQPDIANKQVFSTAGLVSTTFFRYLYCIAFKIWDFTNYSTGNNTGKY